MKYELIIEPAAAKQLQEFLDYAQFEPAATRFVEDLVRRVQILRDFPKLAKGKGFHKGIKYRCLLVKQWRAIYRVQIESKKITIYAFYHPARDFDISVFP